MKKIRDCIIGADDSPAALRGLYLLTELNEAFLDQSIFTGVQLGYFAHFHLGEHC